MSCEECLARSWLLASLGGWIEKIAMNAPGKRARDLLALEDEALAAAAGHPRPSRLVRQAYEKGAPALATAVEASDCWAICPDEQDWPARLGDLGPSAPRALYGCGDRQHLAVLSRGPSVAIVGARRATPYGREAAQQLGLQLGTARIPVVSGMAFGVDAAAHRGALTAAGLTVAVLGGGANVAYPQGEAALHRRIIEAGITVSEMPPGFRPQRWSFPARNRIIAALAEMTIVVQARGRSGALITAQMAGEELGRELGAIPGPINSELSRGPNGLLADGAVVVRGAQDVLDRLVGVGHFAVPLVAGPDGNSLAGLDAGLVAVLAAVEEGAATPDQVAARVGRPPGAVAADLSRLELKGRVRADALGRYARAFDGHP